MPESIPEDLVERRYSIASGKCECCGKVLKKASRGRDDWGAWEAHQCEPGLAPIIDAIRIVCSSPGLNCHLNCCHKGNYNNPPTWKPCRVYGW